MKKIAIYPEKHGSDPFVAEEKMDSNLRYTLYTHFRSIAQSIYGFDMIGFVLNESHLYAQNTIAGRHKKAPYNFSVILN